MKNVGERPPVSSPEFPGRFGLHLRAIASELANLGPTVGHFRLLFCWLWSINCLQFRR